MKIDSITHTYKAHNEDICGNTQKCSWVIDGALPLSKAKFTDDVSDVVWMGKWWNTYLAEHLENMEKTIQEIMEEGIESLNEAFSKYADINELSKIDRASASIGIVRINGETVESFVLGDTEVSILYKDKEIDTLIDERIEFFDRQVIDMIYNNKERGNKIIFNGYTDEEVEVLRSNRMKMNSKEGYYALEHDIKAARHGIYKECQANEVESILIMSDGYSAVYNKYGCLSLRQLFDVCKAKVLKEDLQIIRDEESHDREFNNQRRLRQHDDATEVHILV